MNIETLKSRIANAKKNVEKTKATIVRHEKILAKKSKVLTDLEINLNNYDKFDKDKKFYWEICDYEHKLKDIKNSTKKLKEYEKNLEKLQNTLDVELEKKDNINNVVPKSVLDFLENWKQEMKLWLIEQIEKIIELNFKKYEITKEHLEKILKYDWKQKEEIREFTDEKIEEILSVKISEYEKSNLEYKIKNHYLNMYKKSLFAYVVEIADKVIDYDKIDNNRLEKILNEQVEIRKECLISRITEVVGVITDMEKINFGDNGELNGIVVGKKCNAKIETISAGGYNIQRYHYRVRVNKIK